MITPPLSLSNYAHLLALGILLALPGTLSADPLTRAKVTQTVNDVKISSASGANARPAKAGSSFAIPELLRTGANSRAELIAPDKTVTRVGSNTVFSFKKNQRGINLQQGSVLFHSPTGKGGGEVKTASATASVLGTTIIVAATSNGGFKFMVLEGLGKVIMPNGSEREIQAGNLTFIMPGANNIPQVFEFRLAAQTAGSALINGFNNAGGPVQSFLKKVQAQTEAQEKEIASGSKEGTSLKIGDTLNETDIEIVDADSRSAFFEGIILADIIPEDGSPVVPKPENPFDPEECPNAYAAYELLCTPAVVASSELDPSRVTTFDDPDELIKFLEVLGVFDQEESTIPPSQLFSGSTIVFNTPTLDLTNNYPSFAFMSLYGMTFSQLLELTTDPTAEVIFLTQGVLAMANSGVKGDLAFLEFLGQTGILVGNSWVENKGGSMFFATQGGLVFSDSTFIFSSLNDPYTKFNGFEVFAQGPISIIGSSITEYMSNGMSSFVGIIGEDVIAIEDTTINTSGEVVITNYMGSSNGDSAILDGGSLLDGDDIIISASTGPGGNLPTFNQSSSSMDDGKDIFLTDTNIEADSFYGSSGKDFTIEGTGSNKSKHVVQTYYNVYAQNGKLVIREHTIEGGIVNLGGYLDITLDNLNVKLTDMYSPSFYVDSWNGDININGGTHGLSSGITNGPNRSYAYNAYNGNIRVNETGSQWTNFGSNDTSGGFSNFDFNASETNGTVHMRNANFLNNVSWVNMQARTVNLENVNFGADTIVNLYSQFGMANFGSSLPGYVNFINNVIHQRAPGSDLSNATNFNNFQSSNPGYINIGTTGGGGGTGGTGSLIIGGGGGIALD